MIRLTKAMFAVAAATILLAGCSGAAEDDGDDAATEVDPTEEVDPTGEDAATEDGTGDPVTLRLGHVGTPESLNGIEFNAVADRAAELTDGRLTIELFPNEQLGSEPDMLEQVRSGALDMSSANIDHLTNVVPEWDAFAQPFLIRDFEAADEISRGSIAQDLMNKTGEQGAMKVLSMVFHADRTVLADRAIRTPEDASGMRLREQESPSFLKFWNAVDVTPVGISAPETYTALSQGSVDGATTATWFLASSGWYEAADYWIEISPFFSAHSLVINAESWNSLDSELQTALAEAAAYGRDALIDARDQANADAIQAFSDAGLTLIRADEIDADAWRSVVEENDMWADAAGQEYVKMIQDAGLSN